MSKGPRSPSRASAATPEDDARFFTADAVLCRYITWRAEVEGAAGRARPTREAVEAAACDVAAFHSKHGDDGSQALIIANCRYFHDLGEALPRALQALLIEMAARSAPPRRRGRKAAGVLERETWRTHAGMIQDQIDRGATLEEAAEWVAAFPATAGAKSVSTLLNHYDWARRAQVKSSKSK